MPGEGGQQLLSKEHCPFCLGPVGDFSPSPEPRTPTEPLKPMSRVHGAELGPKGMYRSASGLRAACKVNALHEGPQPHAAV